MLSNVRRHALGEAMAAPREKKPRTYAESDDQKRVVAWIRGRPNWLVMRVENAARRRHAQAARDKALGMEPGAPDLIVMLHTFAFYLEMKSKVGSVSAEQKKLHAQLRARGVPVAIGYGAEATIAALVKLEQLWEYWREHQHQQRSSALHQAANREIGP